MINFCVIMNNKFEKKRIITMRLNKNDIIKDGENYYTVFCIVCTVIYVKRTFDVNSSPSYELEEVLKHYRKVEIIEK